MINTAVIETDISTQTATNAFYWTSFDPEKRGGRVISSYVATLTDLAAHIEAKSTDERQQEAKESRTNNMTSSNKRRTPRA